MSQIFQNLLVNSSDLASNPTHKISLYAADLAALGASTSGTITIDVGAAVGDLFSNFYVNTPTLVVATSMTALTLKVGVTGTLEAFGTAATTDVVAGVAYKRGAGTSNSGLAATASAKTIVLTFAATGANLSAITAGQIDIWFSKNPVSSFFF